MTINGTKVRKELDKQGIGVSEFSACIGITTARVYQILSQKKISVSTDTLGRICKTLKSSPYHFDSHSTLTDNTYCCNPETFEIALITACTTVNDLAKDINVSKTQMLNVSKGMLCTREQIDRVCEVLNVLPTTILWEQDAVRYERDAQ